MLGQDVGRCRLIVGARYSALWFPPFAAHLWGPEEVAAWLERLSLCEYKDTFMRHDIRGSELLHLERRDLKVTNCPVPPEPSGSSLWPASPSL